MQRQVITKSQTFNDGIQRIQQKTVVMEAGTRIHRANILARIIHAISLYKMEWALTKIKIIASNRSKRHKKMGLAINRIFRRAFCQAKFKAMQRIKMQLLQSQQHQIIQSEKIIQSMSKTSKSIMFLVLKSKRKQTITHAFKKIKQYSRQSYYLKRDLQRTAIRKILNFINKNKIIAFDRIHTTQVIAERKNKLRNLTFILASHRKSNISWALWKMHRNLIDKRKLQVQQDIKIFQQKINNNSDPDIQAIKQKKGKLEQHLNKVQQQKHTMEQQFMQQWKDVENKRQQMEDQVKNLEQKKQSLQSQISQVQQKINAPYTMDQIYQCVYYNFLLYIHENKQKVYNKQQLLQTLTCPLIPIDVSIDLIKQENKVMEQLLNQYIVMFGPRKIQGQIKLPYQYLVKQNQVMYKMLLTLLPQMQADRDDLRVIRDNLFKLSAKVTDIWGK